MDILTFIVEMTKALAWPISAVFAFYILREPLIKLVPYIEELKYKDFALKFGKGVSEIKENIKAEITQYPEVPKLLEEENALLRVAEVSPRAAVLESWVKLQDTLLDISLELGQIDSKENFKSHSRIGHALLEAKILNENDFKAFHQLRDLRNRAAHVPDFALNTHDSKEYVKLAIQLASAAIKRKNA